MKALPALSLRALTACACLVLLVSCMPIAPWTPAQGGPQPPIGSTSLRGEPAQSPPTPAPATATPTPEPVVMVEPISMQAAQECLAAGDVVYGLALQNANVRDSADTNACRIGRIPKGSLVRITASVESSDAAQEPAQSDLEAAALLPTATSQVGNFLFADPTATVEPAAQPTPLPTALPMVEVVVDDGPRVGYAEDIQPIFQRVCNSCHSGIVKLNTLQVTEYEPLMQGTITGTVVLPGDAAGSKLWQMLESRRMPLVGTLTEKELALVRDWINLGAPELRPEPAIQLVQATPAPEVAALPTRPAAQTVIRPNSNPGGESARAWLSVAADDYNPVTDRCALPAADPLRVVSSELLLPVSCGVKPNAGGLDLLRASLALPVSGAAVASGSATGASGSSAVTATVSLTATAVDPVTAAASGVLTPSAAVASVAPPAAGSAFAPISAAGTGIQASALGLEAPSDGDGWLTARGGLCVERKLPNNSRGVTAISFAPDGRIFLALDSNLASEVDPLILYDAHHPSRSIGVMDSADSTKFNEILVESTRITGLDWDSGILFVSRAGEVGMIADGGAYEPLAAGFAVTSQLFHANNGIVVSGGWVYVSAGGVMDGWSDGPIVGVGEAGAQQMVSGGNPWAARIVRAPLGELLASKSISAFSTAARGVRNPYGITSDSAGRIWFTDNGATNLPEDVSAGDEVNVLDPAAAGGGEENSPYYGFPLALTGAAPWYARPVLVLPNTAAPTGIAEALGTIYFAQYGKDPGLYRMGTAADGTLIAERVLLGWPILALGTAPDGALWMGMGDGSLFRITGGCG